MKEGNRFILNICLFSNIFTLVDRGVSLFPVYRGWLTDFSIKNVTVNYNKDDVHFDDVYFYSEFTFILMQSSSTETCLVLFNEATTCIIRWTAYSITCSDRSINIIYFHFPEIHSEQNTPIVTVITFLYIFFTFKCKVKS